MDEREALRAAQDRMETMMAEARRVKALLDIERAQVKRIKRVQWFWWFAVFLLGVAVGFAVAELLIDPVTVLMPATGIEV